MLIIWLSLSLIVLMLGGWLTSFGLGEWYDNLVFPPFQPPPWVFTPAWITIFILLAIATWQITGSQGKAKPVSLTFAMTFYGAQLVLNVIWSLLFFTAKRPDFAFGEIIVLDLVLVGMIIFYWRISKTAGLCLVPYLLWLLFATSINGWIVWNNPAFG